MEGPDDRPYYLTPNDVADWCVPSLAWVASVLMVVISFYLYDVGFKCLVHPPHTLSLRRRSLFSSPPLCVLIVLQDGVSCRVVLWVDDHPQGGHGIRSLHYLLFPLLYHHQQSATVISPCAPSQKLFSFYCVGHFFNRHIK